MRYWSLSECVGCRMFNVVHTCTESIANTVLLAYTQKLTVHILYSAYILWTSSICSFNFQTIFASSRTTRQKKKINQMCFWLSLSLPLLSFSHSHPSIFNWTSVFKSTKKKNCGVRKVKIIAMSAKVFLLKHIRKLNCSRNSWS